MSISDNVQKVLTVAEMVAGFEPQIAMAVQLVKKGWMGVQAVRSFFADQNAELGHDQAVLDGIIAEFDGRVKRWQTAHF